MGAGSDMANGQSDNSRLGRLGPIVGLGTPAAAITLKPLAGAASLTMRPIAGVAEAAVGAGRELERRAVERVLESPELERLTEAALDSPRTQAALRTALESEGAKEAVDAFFESGLLDRFLERLLESPALWRLVDDIAASPAVTAAITQQSLGFVDQVQEVVRLRSRRADDRLERGAGRLTPWRSRQRPAATSEPAEPRLTRPPGPRRPRRPRRPRATRSTLTRPPPRSLRARRDHCPGAGQPARGDADRAG